MSGSAPRNGWFSAAIGITAAIAIAGAAGGFIWLPMAQPSGPSGGIWDAICSAAGLFRPVPAGEGVVPPDHATTRVEVTSQTPGDATAEAVGVGATLALRCTMCHGARGLSEAQSPNLAGQYPVAIYKQLADFKAGARVSAVMGPLVAGLSDADMGNLAAYYAYLPRPSASLSVRPALPQIVASGAPMRGIAPCGACHGALASKAGAAWLNGQPAIYLRTQLLAFASGTRRNDIGEQMRNIARGMTPAEIELASQYYADRP